MEPTKCYSVGGYIITDFAQLQYGINKMNKFLKTEKNEESIAYYQRVISSFEKAIEEGLDDNYLLSINEIQGEWTQFPDAIIQTKEGLFFYPAEQVLPFDKKDCYQQISSVDEIINKIPSFPSIKKIIQIEKEFDMYRFDFMINNNEGKTACEIKASLKEDRYWCIENANCFSFSQEANYFSNNITFKKEIFQRLLNRRIDFLFLGFGNLVATKLPIIVDINKTN